MSLSQTQTDTATLDSEIAVLGANLADLQNFARSLPASVTVPLDQHSVFTELEERVSQQFDRLSYVLAMYEGNTLF